MLVSFFIEKIRRRPEVKRRIDDRTRTPRNVKHSQVTRSLISYLLSRCQRRGREIALYSSAVIRSSFAFSRIRPGEIDAELGRHSRLVLSGTCCDESTNVELEQS